MISRSIFIFRRDLRLDDNAGLLRALQESERVMPVFVFDPRQRDPERNPYFSPRAFAFLCASLRELDAVLRSRGSQLFVFEGEVHDVVRRLVDEHDIEAVYANADYTPFARARDEAMRKACDEVGVSLILAHDAPLSPIEDLRTGDGRLYSVFAPFMRRAMTHAVAVPQTNTHTNYWQGDVEGEVGIPTSDPIVPAGHSAGLELLERLPSLRGYAKRRDALAEDGTSRLSVHHKFGTVSIRETYHAAVSAGLDQQFVSELYWRDFYLYIARHFPHVFGRSFLEWGDHITWVNDEDAFLAWQEGRTGFPIVDAGMRQLKETGWMHNRARMIVASFLTKNLLIDWRWGEKHFARELVDYDPAANNGGWQWSASVGADPRPLRIFNPFAQAQKYDPDAAYILRWVPELAAVPVSLLTDGKAYDFSMLASYPAPIIDYAMSYRRAQEAYKAAKRDARD